LTRILRPCAPLRAAAIIAAALGAHFAASPLAAQVPRDTVPRPAPRDTVPRPPRRDTIQVTVPPEALRADTLPDRPRPDSTARDSAAADTLTPAPNFPEFPVAAGAPSFGAAVWEFTREELGRYHSLTLLELLDRISGILITRSGNFGRPAGVALLGGGGGRFRVFLDGWEMRALNGASFDLQRIPLVDVTALRVERDLNEVRVEISTFRLPDARAFAMIEGADGDFNSRILRGYFSRPLGRRFMMQAGLDLSQSAGFRRLDPFSINTLMGRLSYQFRPDFGLQLDYRRSAIDTEQEAGSAIFLQESLDRNEIVLRGRGRFLNRLWVDAGIGQSRESPAAADSINADVSSVQGFGRATMDIGIGNVSGAFRLHRGNEGSYAPNASELSARAVLAPLPWLTARGEVRLRTLGGEAGTETDAMVRAGPFAGVTVFGQIGAGVRAIPFLADTALSLRTFGGLVGRPPLEVPDTIGVIRLLEPTLAGLRAGAELARGPYQLGAAFVAHDVESVAPYGLSFDRGAGLADGGAVTALEGYASAPVFWETVRFDGWFVRRLDTVTRRYLPTYFGRGALEFRNVYRDGNLEPLFRIEAVGRGRSTLPGDTEETTVLTPRYTVFNLFVQVRIVDVRVFYRLDNAFNAPGLDIPGTRIAGSRALYGVRWFFRN
jgi:hypothetical protein